VRCIVGREWNSKHPVCRSCPGPCGNKTVVAAPEVISTTGRQKQPNKTELSYKFQLEMEFPGCEIKFEGLSLYLDTGYRYGPDWVVCLPGGSLLLVEVKNAAYKHASYGRAKVAFAQAILDWPQFKFRWSEKDGSSWEVKNF